MNNEFVWCSDIPKTRITGSKQHFYYTIHRYQYRFKTQLAFVCDTNRFVIWQIYSCIHDLEGLSVMQHLNKLICIGMPVFYINIYD